MNTIRFTSKKAFVDALEARRKFWHDRDAKAAKDHKTAEQHWLADTKAKMRAALKLDYASMKSAFAYDDDPGLLYRLGNGIPSCPRLEEPRLDRALASLGYTQSQVFTVDSKTGAWTDAFDLLTADPDAKATVC